MWISTAAVWLFVLLGLRCNEINIIWCCNLWFCSTGNTLALLSSWNRAARSYGLLSVVEGFTLVITTVFELSSPCSSTWCTACCPGVRASVLRQLRSSGCLSSRTWSWSCPAGWPWGSAPAPTAPRLWADRHARHRLPDKSLRPRVPSPSRHLTLCLKQHHFKRFRSSSHAIFPSIPRVPPHFNHTSEYFPSTRHVIMFHKGV